MLLQETHPPSYHPFYHSAPFPAGVTLCPVASWHPLSSKINVIPRIRLYIPADLIVFLRRV